MKIISVGKLPEKGRILVNFKKKLLHIMLCSSLLGTFLGNMPAIANSGPTPTDLKDSYAASEIGALFQEGIVSGYEDGSFQPTRTMTRQEFAVILAKTLKLPESPEAAGTFHDVEDWAKPYVGALVQSHLSDGIDAGVFGSGQSITREQLSVFFLRALGLEDTAKTLALSPVFTDNSKIQPYAVSYVALAEHIHFIGGIDSADGTNRFEPSVPAQRQAVARLAYELFMHKQNYLTQASRYMELLSTIQAADKAMVESNSYRIMFLTDFQRQHTLRTNLVMELTKKPVTFHQKYVVDGVASNGQPIYRTTELYMDGQTNFIFKNGTWSHSPFTGDLSTLMNKLDTEMSQDRLLIPYLQTSTDGTFFAELSGHDYLSLIPNKSIDSSKLEKVSIRYKLDNVSHLVTDAETTITFNGGDIQHVHVTIDKINNLDPIVVPNEVKKLSA